MIQKIVPVWLLLALISYSVGAEIRSLESLIDAALRTNSGRFEAQKTLSASEFEAKSERASRQFTGSASLSGKRSGTALDDTSPASGSSGTALTGLTGSVEAAASGPALSQISGGASYDVSIPDVGERSLDSLSVQGSIRIPVFVNGKLFDGRLGKAAIRSAIELPLETARAAAVETDRQLADSVVRYALDTASACRAWKIAERNATLAAREAEIAAVRRETGLTGFNELYRVEREADEARVQAQDLRFSYSAKKRILETATGVVFDDSDLQTLSVPDAVSHSDLERLAPPASSAQVLSASRAREAAEYGRILAGATDSPSLSLSAQVTTPGPLARADRPVSGTGWSAGLGVTVPVTAGAAVARREAAGFRLDAARLAEKNALSLEDSTRTALFDSYESALAKEKLRRQLLERTRTRQQEVVLAAASGTATSIDIERASLAVEEAVASFLDACSARFLAALDICELGSVDPVVLCRISSVHVSQSEE